MKKKLILASASFSRQSILLKSGLTFSTIPASIDERAIERSFEEKNLTPEEVALILAEEKALNVAEKESEAFVLGCDQILSLDSKILHKPSDRQEARLRLMQLSGRTHCLNSAVVLAKGKEVLWRYCDRAFLTMRSINLFEIDTYLNNIKEDTLKTVGIYRIEGVGIQLFEEIEGNVFTIMGLPLLPLLKELRQQKVLET